MKYVYPLLLGSLILAALSTLIPTLQAQNLQVDAHMAKKISETIVLDGVLDEAIWQEDGWAGQFTQYFPSDTSLAEAQTRVKVVYDDRNIYIAAVMLNKGPRTEDQYVSTSLRRDYRGEQNDGVSFLFDTFNDKTNAFQFGVNPFGVMRESLIANGGMVPGDLNLAWDNVWWAEAKIYEDYWVVEAMIPFSTLRYNDGAKKWNLNFYRIDSEYNERSTWAPIPRNFSMIALAFMKELHFEEPLKKRGSNVSLIPYVAGGSAQNNIDKTSDPFRPSFGGDAKVGLGPGLNLDLTFNPDFSQVEVDQQVTNLDRFEIFFPEQRQFFLENADLFADFGADRIRPFFSRRIGVDRDERTGQNVQNQILYGARLSGKITDDWRVGAMNMQTASDAERGIAGSNFSVAAVQRKVFNRSNVGMIFVNRERLDLEQGGFNFDPTARNSLIGFDYNLASRDNRWTGKFFYHQTQDEGVKNRNQAIHGQLNYAQVNFNASVSYSNIGENFNPTVGFTPRNDFQRAAGSIGYQWFPRSRLINRHGPGAETETLWNETLGVTDELHTLFYRIQFQSLSTITMAVSNRYTYLFFPFDPTRTGGKALESGTDYRNTFFRMNFFTNPRNSFFVSGRTEIGEYFTGNIMTLAGSGNYRYGYRANISMNFSFNRIRLPEPQSSADLFLIGPRIDLTFSKSLFWTTFVQYNNQIDNLNINTRLQWRYAPVSDFFFVYTDNYFPTTFISKQRALIAKWTYWLNL